MRAKIQKLSLSSPLCATSMDLFHPRSSMVWSGWQKWAATGLSAFLVLMPDKKTSNLLTVTKYQSQCAIKRAFSNYAITYLSNMQLEHCTVAAYSIFIIK